MPTEHWAATWLARLEDLNLEMERWPEADFAADGRPIKIFLDGALAVRLRADDDGVTLEFMTKDNAPKGFTARGSRWEATFTDEPDEALQRSWLDLLSRFGTIRQPVVDTGPPQDDAYRWVWEARERLLERNLWDRDRKPFCEHMRAAFGDLTDDEQKLLRAQWAREAMEDGPTVAETLGWTGKQVMDTYRSAMASMKSAAKRYQRPRRPRR